MGANKGVCLIFRRGLEKVKLSLYRVSLWGLSVFWKWRTENSLVQEVDQFLQTMSRLCFYNSSAGTF